MQLSFFYLCESDVQRPAVASVTPPPSSSQPVCLNISRASLEGLSVLKLGVGGKDRSNGSGVLLQVSVADR